MANLSYRTRGNSKLHRKSIAILLCAALTLTTAACGTDNNAHSDTTETLATEQSTADESLSSDTQTEAAEEIASTEDADNRALLALAAESIYAEDENEYGNSIGNIYHDGVVTSGVSGSVYYYNMYDGNIYLFLESVDIGILLAEEDILYLNYSGGVLYGVKGDGAIAAYDISEQKETILRETDAPRAASRGASLPTRFGTPGRAKNFPFFKTILPFDLFI